MIELISAQPAWFWLCLGGLLLIGELLGTAGYLYGRVLLRCLLGLSLGHCHLSVGSGKGFYLPFYRCLCCVMAQLVEE